MLDRAERLLLTYSDLPLSVILGAGRKDTERKISMGRSVPSKGKGA